MWRLKNKDGWQEHLDVSQKLHFFRGEIGTLTSADASGLTVWSTNVRTNKIDYPTLKLFSIAQVEEALWNAFPIFLSNAAVCFAKAYLEFLFRRQSFIHFDQSFIQSLSKIRQFLPHIPWPRMHPSTSSENTSFSKDMAENNEVVGSGEQLVDW